MHWFVIFDTDYAVFTSGSKVHDNGGVAEGSRCQRWWRQNNFDLSLK
jgi:hypothetical protein